MYQTTHKSRVQQEDDENGHLAQLNTQFNTHLYAQHSVYPASPIKTAHVIAPRTFNDAGIHRGSPDSLLNPNMMNHKHPASQLLSSTPLLLKQPQPIYGPQKQLLLPRPPLVLPRPPLSSSSSGASSSSSSLSSSSTTTTTTTEPLSEHGIITLSKNGLKSKEWGPVFWDFYCSLSTNMKPATHSTDLVIFYFKQSFGSTGPCVHCRNSHVEFVNMPDNQIEMFLSIFYDEIEAYPNEPSLLLLQHNNPTSALYQMHYGDNLLKWLYAIKNHVNTKLDKPFVDYTEVAHYYLRQHAHLWEQLFWYWLYCQVINYPVDVSLEARRQSPLLNERCRDYVEVIEQIRNLLPEDSALYACWVEAYFHNPPTVDTFSSREKLFVWLYQMEVACGCTDLSLEQTGALYEQLRASSCKDTVKTCN
jgi:hypothetical protein